MSKESEDELERLISELANIDSSDIIKNVDEDNEEEIVVPARLRRKAPPTEDPLPEIDVSIDDVSKDKDNLLSLETNLETVIERPSDDLSTVFEKQLKKVASQYGTVFEEIISNYKRDREQAQEVIDQFMDVICQGGKIPRVYLEKIADAVRAKNEIAQTAIKALGELPKLISSTKNNDMFQNNVSMSFDAAHLKEILKAADDE